MKKYLLGVTFLFAVLVMPISQAQASNLTNTQIQAILSILSSFGADSNTIASVNIALTGGTPSSPTPSSSFCYRFNNDLTVNSYGSDVMALTRALNAGGFTPSDYYSSDFTEDTAAYVIRFQDRYNIRQTGYVGTATRARLNTLYRCATPQTNVPTPSSIPTISNVQSPGSDPREVIAGERASIYGTGLRGPLTIRLGVQEVQTVSTTGTSNTYAEFTVPSRTQSAVVNISVTNSSGQTSFPYEIVISVPTTQTNTTPTPTPTPTVTVVSPNGGENWYRGQTYLVTWRSANVPSSDDQVLIRLRSGSTGREYDLATTRNDGAHSITIPTTVPEGTYTLEIKTTVAGYMDGSDSSFEIDDRTTETPTGTLSFSQSAFNFSYTQNGNIPSNQSLTFENTSSTNVNYTISVPNQPSWLNTSYNTSVRTSYPGRDTSLATSINPSGLSPGVYVTNIVLTGNFSGSPKSIPVTLTVIAPSAVQTVAPVITLTVNGSTYNGTTYDVNFGGTANIGWGVTPTSGTLCAAAGNGVWGTSGSGSVAMSGSWTTPRLYTDTTYGIMCTNAAGTTYKYVSIGVQAQTNTTTSGNTAPTITLNGSSNSSILNMSTAFGGTATFRWSVTQPSGTVTTCNAAGTGIGDPSGGGNMALSGSWTTPRLYTTVTYGMACSNTNAAGVTSGTTYKYARVTVAEQTSTVTPEPTPAARCSAQTITWSGTGSGCSGSISEAGSGSYANVNNTVAGKKGTARFDCNNGTWTKNETPSSCINYCSADGALLSPATVREKDGARSSCQSPGYSWQTPSWVGSGALSSGFCAYGSYNYANDTLGILNGQCYNCSVGSWVPITSSYCRTY